MFALGHLVKIILTTGETIMFEEAKNFLVYDPVSNNLLITDPLKGSHQDAAPDADYLSFHSRAPEKTTNVEWFKPTRGQMVDRGVMAIIHYYVPKHFISAKKNKEYAHTFGDFGDARDLSEVTDESRPLLQFDLKRNRWHIMRQSANAWFVDDFIRG